MLGRHQFGGDRKRRRDRKAEKKAGDEAQDQQLFETVYQQDQQGAERAEDDTDLHYGQAADPVGHRRRGKAADDDQESRPGGECAHRIGVHMQRRFGEHQQGAGQRQIIAFDKADKPEHQDDNDVIGAERHAVEFASEHEAGGDCPRLDRIGGHPLLLPSLPTGALGPAKPGLPATQPLRCTVLYPGAAEGAWLGIIRRPHR